MSGIGAVSTIAVPQMAQLGQATKPVDRDGDHDSNKPDPAMQQAKEARAVAQHKVNVEA
jgi:hypothetical protein